jgi:BirA family biotin operon repressor/biotin-[acetyl-CoA-carboxylase] ligase
MPLRRQGVSRHHAGSETIDTMSDQPLRWGAEALWEQLTPDLPGLSVEVVARISSTNTALLERARIAAPPADDGELAQVRRSVESSAFGRRAADLQPCLLVAEHQTHGRGRHGRVWQAAPGASLTFSLALPLAPHDWSGLSLAVGVALADALDPLDARGAADGIERAPRLAVKWPNDLWLIDGDGGGRKLGGILIETVVAGSRRLAVIGVGINVMPLSTGEAGSAYACVQEIDADATAPGVLTRVAKPLVEALRRFERDGFAAFVDAFARRDLLRGRAVRTTSPEAPDGVAVGVSEQGALLLRTVEGIREVSSGEVSVRLDAPGKAA